MPDPSNYRNRTLFLLAVRDYLGNPAGFAEGINAQLDIVREWWADPRLGDRALHPVELSPVDTRHDVERAVHKCGLRELTSEDVAVVYVTGHGTRGGSGRHYLLLPQTPPGEYLGRGYPTAELVTAVLASQARHVVVIVDSCFAGELEAELAQLRKDLPAARRLRSMTVFATADFDEAPRVAEFTCLLAAVREWLCSEGGRKAGYAEPWLSIDDFADELYAAHQRSLDAAHQRPRGLAPRQVWREGPSGDPSPCLPNPAFVPPRYATAPARQQVATSVTELDYWLDRASGRVSPADPGWYFAGRRTLTTALAEFLREGTGMLLVTGVAGSGKSAIVARAVTLSDPEFRRGPRYAAAIAAAPPSTVPPTGSIDAAVLARNKTADEIAADLVGALGATPVTAAADRVAALRDQLRSLLLERGPTTLVLDGLDEATTPTLVILELIGPLLRPTGNTERLARLIIGVRSPTPNASTQPGSPPSGPGLLDLLHRFDTTVPVTEIRTDHPNTHTDIAEYLTALLAHRYRGHDTERDHLAHLIASHVTPSFLDARFAGQRLRDSPHLVTTADADLIATLREGTVGLLRQDLLDAATPDHDAQTLLTVARATAFGQGTGIPWDDIWPAIASAILNHTVPDTAIRHLLNSRLSGYLARDTADGRLVFKPVHATLTTILRNQPHRLTRTLGNDNIPSPEMIKALHQRITHRLTELLPTHPGVRPHPYLSRHLVDHAIAGDVLDDTHIPAGFLPFDASCNVRAGLGLPTTDTPDHATLAAWARIEPFLSDASPASRALSLDFAITTTGHATNTVHSPGLRPRWAHWPLTPNVLFCQSQAVNALTTVHLGPDGRALLASGGFDRTVRLWDPVVGHAIGEALAGHDGPVWALAELALPDGRVLLASGGADGTVRLWDPVVGHAIGEALAGHDGPVRALAELALPGGRVLLASGGFDRRVRLWDPDIGCSVGEPLTGHDGDVWALVALALRDGRVLLASGDENGTVRLWDPDTGCSVGEPLTGHNNKVSALAAASLPDGRILLASGGDDGRVRLWDPDIGCSVGEPLTGHDTAVEALVTVVLPDGQVLLASADLNGTVRLWDPGTGRPVGEPLTGHDGTVWALAVVSFSDGRVLLASGGIDGTVRLWDPAGYENSRPSGQAFSDHRRPARKMAVVPFPDGRVLLASSGIDWTLDLWDPATGHSVGHHLRVDNGSEWEMVPLSDGRVLLANSSFGTVTLWDPATSRPVGHPLTPYELYLRAVAMVPLPDRRELLAISGNDGRVRLWDPDTGCSVGEPFTGHDRVVSALAVVPLPERQALLACGAGDGTVRLWNPVTRQPVGESLPGHDSAVRALAVVSFPDGRVLLASGGNDGRVRLWDLDTGRPVGEPLAGHTNSVVALAPVLFPDGRVLLASGGTDGTVRLWDPITGVEIIRVVTGAPVDRLAVHPPTNKDSTPGFLAVGGRSGIAVLDLTYPV